MAKIHNLSTFLARISNAYDTARIKYLEIEKDYQECEKRYNTAIKSGTLNNHGIELEKDVWHVNKQRIGDKLKALREEFNAVCEEEKESVRVLFADLYEVNPKKLDTNAVEIIKSGMLTPSECVRMANKYRADGNFTMFRYLGIMSEELAEKNQDNFELRNIVTMAKQTPTRPDIGILEGFQTTCNKCLSDEFYRGNGVHNMAYQNSLNSYMSEAEKISVKLFDD